MDVGQNHVTGRWVCTRKVTEEGFQNKARYVVRGFQEKSTIQLEASTQNKLWKLKKCVYGLNDAARMRYFAVWEELKRLGCKRSSVDYGVFTWFNNNKEMAGVFQSHVDDFLWSGTDSFERNVIQLSCIKFKVGNQSTKAFKYVGINITQGAEDILLDQVDYIQEIQPISLTRDRQIQKEELCNRTEAMIYRQLVEKLNWVANQSRPDILFDVCQLSSFMKTPNIGNMLRANKILSKIKEYPLRTKFLDLGDLKKIKLLCYSDASLGNLPSGKSTGGYVIFLAWENGTICPLSWKTKILTRVVRSTISAETSAMIDALDSAYFLSYMVSEILGIMKIPIVAFTDNDSLYRNAHSTTMTQERRLRFDLAVNKQMLYKKELSSFQWISASDQLADCLTKQGSNPVTRTRAFENGKMNE